ncbi:MAG: GTP 3',8-cyclase MoaA [Terricaulis sp.]
MTAPAPALLDQFQRHITYLRVSVTDRCDLRCVYCMPERMEFLPKTDVLSFEELDRLCAVFVQAGVRKLRITGGEPLVRRDIMAFLRRQARHLDSGQLEELTLTTNGTRLAAFAAELAAIGVKRVNVSLDTLDAETFQRITRRDQLSAVLAGIEAARNVGLQVKLNVVALKNDNLADIPDIIQWAHERGMDVSLIETMPMGEVEGDRTDQFVSLAAVRAKLGSFWRLSDIPDSTGGPSRYARIEETGGRLGFITPFSHNFCSDCNRVRLTCTGRLYLCLGQDEHIDFREPLRSGASESDLLGLIGRGLSRKPRAHDFQLAPTAPPVRRHMSMTGG